MSSLLDLKHHDDTIYILFCSFLHIQVKSHTIMPKDLSKQTVETVTPHEFRKFFGIILIAPNFGDGSGFIWRKDTHGIFSLPYTG